MNDIPYPYDRTLYSRLFLNCYQRESLVMLAELGHPVHQLLFRCLVSTDGILRQVIREQRPKYSFDSDLLDPDGLARIGIVKEEAEFDSYADARGLLLDVVAQEGYAILVGRRTVSTTRPISAEPARTAPTAAPSGRRPGPTRWAVWTSPDPLPPSATGSAGPWRT
jgi:hypothetical protein